jgi:hypothetical protein
VFRQSSLNPGNGESQMNNPAVKVRTKTLGGIQNCRVLEIGVENLAECLQQGPSTCSYALPFGYCFLCKHPRLDEIIANTKKAQSVGELRR